MPADNKTSFSYYLLFIYSLGIYFGAPYMIDYFNLYDVAPNKIYSSFESFYPFYLTQHSNNICRRLHFVGTSIIIYMALFDLRIAFAMIPAALSGLGASYLTRGLPEGLYEMIVMMAVFQLCLRFQKVSILKSLSIPLIAYSFAWIGHFQFEHNKPATFTYPAYSLISDFKMWCEIASTKIPF